MNEQALQRLLAEYETAELRLSKIVANYVLLGMDESQVDSTWAATKLSQVKQLHAATVKVLLDLKQLDKTAQQLVIDAYKQGLNIIPNGLIGTNIDAANALAQELTAALTTSRYQILRKTVDAYRQIIGNVESQTVLGVNTRIEAARKALGEFADKGIIAFVDNSGKTWDIQGYTAMATRTATHNALREGRIQGLVANDKDLIIIRTGARYCPLCAPYRDKVLSITGDTSGYPSLDSAKAAGLYHPQCRCSFAAYIPGITDKRSKDTIDNNYEKEEDLRYTERQTRKWKRRL